MTTRLIRHTVLTALADMSKPSYKEAKKLIEKLADTDGENVISCQSLTRALAAFDTHRRKLDILELATHLCRILPIQESDIRNGIALMSKSPKLTLEDAVDSAFTDRIKPDEIVKL